MDEFLQLLTTNLIQMEYGPDPDEVPIHILKEFVADPSRRFAITSAGREHLEKKGTPRKQFGAQMRAHLQQIPPSLSLSKSWLSRARAALKRAGNLEVSKDWSGSVSNAQKAIEVALKATFPLVGLKAPEEHDVSSETLQIIERVSGADKDQVRARIARLAILNRLSASLHQVSEYGFLGLSERDLLDQHDSEVWIRYAAEAVSIAAEVIEASENGQVSAT